MIRSILIDSSSHCYREEETRSAENETKSMWHRSGFAEEEWNPRNNLTLLGLTCILNLLMDQQLCLSTASSFSLYTYSFNVYMSFANFSHQCKAGKQTWSQKECKMGTQDWSLILFLFQFLHIWSIENSLGESAIVNQNLTCCLCF